MKIKKFHEFFEEEQIKNHQSEEITKDEEEISLEPVVAALDVDLGEAKNPEEITEKDKMRISDIIKKAAGNKRKMMDLAMQMAKSITDKYKAMRRWKAAEEEPEIADIFKKRAEELGAFGA